MCFTAENWLRLESRLCRDLPNPTREVWIETMLVNALSYGQLGNRLFLYAHLIAAAEHYGTSLSNPCFAEYAHLFPATQDDLWCRYPVVEHPNDPSPSLARRKLLARFVESTIDGLGKVGLNRYPARILRLAKDQVCDLASDDFSRHLVPEDKKLFLSGWLFRSDALLENYGETIRNHFRIQPTSRNRVDELIGARRNNGDVLIGIHIRQGDYATFRGGQFYYTIDQYASFMRQVVADLAPLRPCFLVCGNGNFSQTDFAGLNVTLGTGHLIEDLYSLAETDLLVGPPSTFTLWASFYGRVPLCQIQAADQSIDVSLVQRSQAA